MISLSVYTFELDNKSVSSFTTNNDNEVARAERFNEISFSNVILIAVVTRIYGFVLSRYASMLWQSILYGTFCVSRICHSRHITRFGYHTSDIVTLFEENRNIRNAMQFQTFVKTKSSKSRFSIRKVSLYTIYPIRFTIYCSIMAGAMHLFLSTFYMFIKDLDIYLQKFI